MARALAPHAKGPVAEHSGRKQQGLTPTVSATSRMMRTFIGVHVVLDMDVLDLAPLHSTQELGLGDMLAPHYEQDDLIKLLPRGVDLDRVVEPLHHGHGHVGEDGVHCLAEDELVTCRVLGLHQEHLRVAVNKEAVGMLALYRVVLDAACRTCILNLLLGIIIYNSALCVEALHREDAAHDGFLALTAVKELDLLFLHQKFAEVLGYRDVEWATPTLEQLWSDKLLGQALLGGDVDDDRLDVARGEVNLIVRVGEA
eukprot:CAMPEP_0174754766 /NCGR_PEP_ID=MMETSP1094-20130205/105905_1 /TAXON_ID=156173 /ORGANISM="Chrysochromulina brevifilum, Strain UTEX LB 985" /LENGTH=255 /DNA_ID=CAMNT_0015960649 /DNA_START=921 /DNA_END=1687 /DNA_ORIENTATION=+